MPRDGANILSNVRVPVLTVVCEPCGRHERYDVESLKRQHGGDVKMPGLLAALVADCLRRARSVSMTGAGGCTRGGMIGDPSVCRWGTLRCPLG
jgi:hypothetical protein